MEKTIRFYLTVNTMPFKLEPVKSLKANSSFFLFRFLFFFFSFFLLVLFWLGHQQEQQDSKSSYRNSTFSRAENTIMFYLCHSCGQGDKLEY